MRIVLLTTFLLCALGVNAQWNINKETNYVYAPSSKSEWTRLQLGNHKGIVYLTLQGISICEQNTEIVLSFKINGKWEDYKVTDDKPRSSLLLFTNLSDDKKALDLFKKCSDLKITTYQEYCSKKEQEFMFNMKGSTSAYNFKADHIE